MSLPNNKILVTGGTGYIGSHTVVELLNRDYEVIIIDNLSNSKKNVLTAIEQITGKSPVFEEFDLRDQIALSDFFNRHKDINGVIHFAAFKAVGESVEKPLLYYDNNVTSLVNLLLELNTHQINNLVFSSSCTVYGQPDTLPVTEKAQFKKAWSPYGNTKQIGEQIIEDVCKYTPLKGISLRYFNPIGAHESALIGELPNGVPTNLVPFITQTAIGKREKLNVYGDDYNTPDGSCIRDYINVVDLAKAHIIALERLLKNNTKSNYEFFNLGTGDGVSVLEAIRSFEKVSGVKLNFQIVARRPGDVEQIYADTHYAEAELGWKAERTLDETMLSAWNWEKQLHKKNQHE